MVPGLAARPLIEGQQAVSLKFAQRPGQHLLASIGNNPRQFACCRRSVPAAEVQQLPHLKTGPPQ
jgi:hypothetical protein